MFHRLHRTVNSDESLSNYYCCRNETAGGGGKMENSSARKFLSEPLFPPFALPFIPSVRIGQLDKRYLGDRVA